MLGCGGGLVVSVLAFYSDDPSSIPAEVYNFFCKIVVEKNENKQKEAGVGPIFKTLDVQRGSAMVQLFELNQHLIQRHKRSNYLLGGLFPPKSHY